MPALSDVAETVTVEPLALPLKQSYSVAEVQVVLGPLSISAPRKVLDGVSTAVTD